MFVYRYAHSQTHKNVSAYSDIYIGNCNIKFIIGFDIHMWDWIDWIFKRNQDIILYLLNNSKPNYDKPSIYEFDQT